MKYILPLTLLLLLSTDTDAMTYRRKRAKEGFMGAPARHAHKKANACEITGAVVGAVGNAAIDEARRKRTHTTN